MSKIKFDLEAAKWIVAKAQTDRDAFPVELATCEKCGASYLPELGHTCSNVVEIDFHDKSEDTQ